MELVHVFMVGNESVCSWVSGGKLRSFFYVFLVENGEVCSNVSG